MNRKKITKFQVSRFKFQARSGFTLIEILVAATIFVVVVSALTVLFNYTLKINRRTEALRQATQGMRNFVEFLVKEVRNGQIDYGVVNGQTRNTGIYPIGTSPCNMPVTPASSSVASTYVFQDNKIAIHNLDGNYECFYLAYGPGNTAGQNSGDPVTPLCAPGAGSCILGVTANNPKPVLALQKSNVSGVEILNPPNTSVQKLVFLVRPSCDPYSPYCQPGTVFPKTQPFVTILAQFSLTLPTGEQSTINYQTTVSTNKYDVPNK